MDLEVHEVSELMDVPENVLIEWVEDGDLPAYYMDNRYRFNRQEIEAWLMRKKANHLEHDEKKSGTKKPSCRKKGVHRFNFFRALCKGDVFCDIEGKTKDAVISSVISRLAPKLQLDSDVLYEAFLERERLLPTSLGNGVAIPHARDLLLNGRKDFIAVVFLNEAIPYESLDGKDVDTLFFLLASDDRHHLGLLSKVAHFAKCPDARSILTRKPKKDVLLEHVKNWEMEMSLAS